MNAIARDTRGASEPGELADLRLLFHKLNNQLGIILSHAELLEAKAPDNASRSRAVQVIQGALDAMATAREIRLQIVGAASRDV